MKVFVFGSNTHGIHGAGAAKEAYRNYGARWGIGYGHHGQSFAIPTKGAYLQGTTVRVGETLSLNDIEDFVRGFLAYARHHENLTFMVTRIGCGLAGYSDKHIAPMFANAPSNCQFDSAWKHLMEKYSTYQYTYWGTF